MGFLELEFHINDRTPDSISAKELLKYMSALINQIKDDRYVHFKEVRDGSACPVFMVREDYYEKVHKKITDDDSKKRLNKELAEQDTNGYLKWHQAESKIIPFPDKIALEGNKLFSSKNTITIYDETAIKGRITSIFGKDDTVNIEIQGSHKETYKCFIDRDRAKELRWDQYICAEVKGEWIRLESGEWTIPPRKRLEVTTYKDIEKDSIEHLLENMSGLIGEDTFNNIQRNLILDTEGGIQ